MFLNAKIICISLILLSLCMNGSLQAQETKHKKDSVVIGWLELGAGTGWYENSGRISSGILGMHVQFNRNLFSLRTATVAKSLSTSYTDIALLYGRVLVNPSPSKPFFSSFSTGISYLSNTYAQFGLFGGPSGPTSDFSGLGIPLQATFHYRPFTYVGIGLTSFGNINSRSLFGGITFSVQFGRLKK